MYGWGEYVPVAKRKEQAQKKIKQLRKRGKIIEPIEIQGRGIAKKCWGKKWCDHLETFSDYENRLPRGRTYVRNGSVCHLGIKKGIVDALVAGSEIYKVKISIETLKQNRWETIKDQCSGQIGSLLELLQGRLSNHVMDIVANSTQGLFPLETEIQFSCSCPDWADMCKHIAAVLYGIGSRLDDQPDLLFLLRDVDPTELINAELVTSTADASNVLDDTELVDIFDIELDKTSSSNEKIQPPKPKPKKPKRQKSALNIKTITGKRLKKMRTDMHLSAKELATILAVTPGSIYRWETTHGVLKLSLAAQNTLAKLLN